MSYDHVSWAASDHRERWGLENGQVLAACSPVSTDFLRVTVLLNDEDGSIEISEVTCVDDATVSFQVPSGSRMVRADRCEEGKAPEAGCLEVDFTFDEQGGVELYCEPGMAYRLTSAPIEEIIETTTVYE